MNHEGLSETYSTVTHCPQCEKKLHYLFNRLLLDKDGKAITCPDCKYAFIDRPQQRF